jgi:hypothetical protein
VRVVCCQVEVSVSGRSLVQRSPINCGVSECDLGTSTQQALAHWGCRAIKKKDHEGPLQAWTGPQGSWRLRLPVFLDSRHMKVVRLSALNAGRLYPPRKRSCYSFLLEAELTPGPLCCRKDSDTIGNRTRNLPACSAVSQSTTSTRAPFLTCRVLHVKLCRYEYVVTG